MIEERWRISSDPRYQVSDLGRFRRSDNGRVRTPSSTPSGYKVLVLSQPGAKHKGIYLHREVMEAFVGPCPKGMQVSHLNGDNSDNRLCNLRYETPRENNARKLEHGTLNEGERNGAAKITRVQALLVRELMAAGHPAEAVAAQFGISRTQVYRIARGGNWRLDST